jgi:F420-dependent oxidoreductase-like protein
MLLGLQVADFTWPDAPAGIGPTFARIARDAEASGMASLWVMDHFFQIEMLGPPQHEMLEAYTALAFAAAATEKVSLGTLVTGVTYRHPGILLKTVTTLDVLSGGRAYLGIGAAWNEEEHRGLGVAYPALSERFERLEETLQIAERMFSGDETGFSGQHYRLERPLNSPAPVSSPRPRILVGGSGERKGLRLVAQYADACNIFEMPLEAIAHKLEVLRGHCDALGRDYDAIERTTLGSLALSRDGRNGTQTVSQAVERFAALAAIGIDHAIVNMPRVHDEANFELMPELTAQLATVVSAGR